MRLKLKPPGKKDNIVIWGVTMTCGYPDCNEQHKAAHMLNVSNRKNESAEIPFCLYHFYVVAGNHFTCEKVSEDGFLIKGPFQKVALIEQVMGAREMVAIIKEKELTENKKP